MDADTLYTLLGIEEDATLQDIKRAYRARVRECHPDKVPEDLRSGWLGKQAEERFKEINQAYEILIDPYERRKYDDGLREFRKQPQEEAAASPKQPYESPPQDATSGTNPEPPPQDATYSTDPSLRTRATPIFGVGLLAVLFISIAAVLGASIMQRHSQNPPAPPMEEAPEEEEYPSVIDRVPTTERQGISTSPTPSEPPDEIGYSATLIEAGGYHTCALLNTGSIQCWGDNHFDQLGNGTEIDSNVPVPVMGVTTATAITAGGYHTCALLNTGSVQCWGWGSYGQIGDGTDTNSNVPVSVTGVTTATAITAGWNHTCALLNIGSVQCWGENGDGELGNGTDTESNVPVPVMGVTTAIGITAGGNHTCALLNTGSVQCWGGNDNGQLGNGTNTNSTVPVPVTGVTTATAITAGENHTCALLNTGSIQCWGTNSDGQLGNGTNTGLKICNDYYFGYCSTTPVLVKR